MDPPKNYGAKAISNKYVFEFVTKRSYSFIDLIVIYGVDFRLLAQLHRKHIFFNTKLSFRNKTLFGNVWSKHPSNT